MPADLESLAEEPDAAERSLDTIDTILDWLESRLQNTDDADMRRFGRVLVWKHLWVPIQSDPRYLALLMLHDAGHQLAAMQHTAFETYLREERNRRS